MTDYKVQPPDAQVVPVTRAVAAVTASSTAFEATRGFHANVSETIVVDFAEGATGVSLVVVAGQCYPYRIVKVTTGTGVCPLY